MPTRPSSAAAARTLALLVASAAATNVAHAAPRTPMLPIEAAAAAEPAPDIGPCALRYKDSLARIGDAELPRIRAAIAAEKAPTAATPAPLPAAADPALPGRPLFVSPARKRSQAEIAAMTAAVALARSRGATTTMIAGAATDRAWIAGRLQEELGDYLRQKPTAFLCRGVPAYLETLRKAANRIGASQDNRAAWIATVRASAERSIEAADKAIAAAKPVLATAAVADAELRPAGDIARNDAPPPPSRPALDTQSGLLAAIDALLARTRAAGLVFEPPVPAYTGATVAPAPLPRPVLARLDALKPLVASGHPLVRDQPVRLKLVAAFADIEMLDYLMQAAGQPVDPVAGAIGAAFEAIGTAHRADCTCGD